MRPLAIIEHDRAFSAELSITIQSAGFRTECFDDPRDALAALRQRPFSLAILNLDGSDRDPYALCREASRIVPLITVTSAHTEDRRVWALEAGADDCVVRPVARRELLARIRNVLRRAAGDDGVHLLDSRALSIAEMRVRTEDGVTHDLTRGETELLALLLDHAPTPLTPARIAQILPAARTTIESRIKSLRAKLGPGRLVSRGRLGYQLTEY